MIELARETELVELAVVCAAYLLTQLRLIDQLVHVDLAQLVGYDDLLFEDHSLPVLDMLL